MISNRILLFITCLICPLLTIGQEFSIKTDYPEVVREGEQFAITWTINSGDGEFTAPEFTGFYKIMGPQTSYSSSTQIINGKVTRETTFSYVYYLQALKQGKFIIAPASVKIKNKIFRSDSLRIEVIAGSNVQQNVQSGETVDEEARQTPVSSDDIFLNIILDRKEVFQGEHIVATIKLYTRIDITGINEIKFPAFEGFVKTDLETPPLTSLKRETINGITYGTGVIQQFLLYPQVSGDITIDPVQISVLVQQKSGRTDPFFGDFFSTYTTIPRAVVSKPARIKVNPLPGQKPTDFSGIVGKIDMTASLDKDSVNVNDAINLRIVLSGMGNLKLAALPELNIPPDIEVYDPKVSENLTNGTNGTTGRKTYEYILIPRHNGDFTISPVSLSYFNPLSRQYERLNTAEITFHAKKTTGESTDEAFYDGVTKEDIKYLGKDIRFIKSKAGRFSRETNLLIGSRIFYSIYLIALFVFVAILFIRREQVKRNADMASVRNRKAAKIAKKRLKIASSHLRKEPKDKFYEEILKSLYGYLSDKLGIPASDLTKNNASDSLKEKGISDETISLLLSILDKCEFARYAPSSSDTDASDLYEEASLFIKSVENKIG